MTSNIMIGQVTNDLKQASKYQVLNQVQKASEYQSISSPLSSSSIGAYFIIKHTGGILYMNKEIKFALEMLGRLPQKGPFMQYVEPRVKYKLDYCPYGQCKMFRIRNTIYLKSYETLVAFYNQETKQFYIDGLYSTTTRRHINAFLQEMVRIQSFVPFKKYIGKALINSYTRETEEIEEEE